MKIKPSLLIIAFAFSPFLLFAGEELSFTTYYPSPYGSYHEFRAQHLAVGNTYVTDPDTCWENCPAAATPIDNNTNLVVEGNVGIGTRTASARLTVQGSSTTSATSALHIIHRFVISNLFVRDDGYVGIRTVTPQPHPKGQPGNLDVNDVYFRSTGTWFSQTILTGKCSSVAGGTINSLDKNKAICTATVTGPGAARALPGDVVLIGLPENYHSVDTNHCGPYEAMVVVANTVKVYLWNVYLSASCTYPGGTYTIKVIKQ